MQDLPLDIQVQLNRIYDYGHLTRILIGYSHVPRIQSIDCPDMFMRLEFY